MQVAVSMRVSGCFLLFVSGLHVGSQGVRAVAADHLLLNAYVKAGGSAVSPASNPALVAFCTVPTISIYSERRFLLSQLTLYEVSGVLPVSSGGFALHGARFGGTDRHESGLGLGYARKLGTLITAGARFNWFSFATQGYRSHNAVNFELGLLMEISEGLRAGVHLDNPMVRATKGSEKEALLSEYSLGVGWAAAPNFSSSALVSKSRDGPVSVRCGFEYRFEKGYVARAGFNAAAGTYYLGSGIRFHQLTIDVTASLHPQLGVSPGLRAAWRKREEE